MVTKQCSNNPQEKRKEERMEQNTHKHTHRKQKISDIMAD